MVLPEGGKALSHSTVVDLNNLVTHPEQYRFFTFRPGLKKLMLSGAAEGAHISILWYTTASDGTVGLHYHAMTEAVYVIDGAQRDAKGRYCTGSLCFNPPGSGHKISNSTGFFLLAYAAPPDFTNLNYIKGYTPITIDGAGFDSPTTYPFERVQDGIEVYKVPLESEGGMTAQVIQSTSADSYTCSGNYLLVLRGRCCVNGAIFNAGMLTVATGIKAQSYSIRAAADSSYSALCLSFSPTEERQKAKNPKRAKNPTFSYISPIAEKDSTNR